MASNSKPFGIKIHGYIGDTEIKSKRKGPTRKCSSKNVKKPKFSEEYGDTVIYPESLLQIEVKESEELISPTDVCELPVKSKENSPEPSTKQTKRSARLKNKVKKVVSEELEFIDIDQDSDYDPRADKQKAKEIKLEFSCPICNMEFCRKKYLNRHLAVHQGNIKCPVCGISFRSKMNMGKHISSAHKKKETCQICPAEFHTKEQLEEHIKKNKHVICKSEQEEKEYLEKTYLNWSGDSETGNLPIVDRSEVNYDIQTAIVSKMHKAVPVKDICRMHNVTPDVVSEIWNDRDKFILPKKISRRTIKYVNSVIEPPIVEWYNKEKIKNVCITGRMIQNLAENIARDKGFYHFYAGDKWLEGFKKRHEISLSSSNRYNSKMPSESAWKSKFFEERWQKIRPEFSDDDIYMADEVGLFYNPSKSREKKFAGKKFIQGETIDRLSILVCTNISGTDKRKLLVCGVEDPLKNSFRNPSTLPVEYKRHSECHFTTSMFEEYVRKWNQQLHKKNKTVLLLLDRASIHSKLKLTNLKLEFLPWKAVNTLMAIKNGVYTRLRTEFRNLLLMFKTMNVMKGYDRNLTCLEALEMLDKAWDRVPPHVITKSFLDLGYEVEKFENKEEVDTDKDNEKYCEYLRNYDVETYFGDLNTLDMYLTVDDDLIVGKGTNPTLFGGNHKSTKEKSFVAPAESSNELPLNTNRPDSNEKELLVQKTRALADLEIVRKFLQSKDTSYNMYCNFMNVEKEVMENFVKFNVV